MQVPYGKFLQARSVWAVIITHFCFNWSYYTLLAWLPSYFDLALGLDVSQSSSLTLIPYLSMVVMTAFVGPTADGLIARGWSITSVRKLCQAVSLLGPCGCMLALSMLTPPAGDAAAGLVDGSTVTAIVVLMSVAFALSAWSRAGLYCIHQDMSLKCALSLFSALPVRTCPHGLNVWGGGAGTRLRFLELATRPEPWLECLVLRSQASCLTVTPPGRKPSSCQLRVFKASGQLCLQPSHPPSAASTGS